MCMSCILLSVFIRARDLAPVRFAKNGFPIRDLGILIGTGQLISPIAC